MKKNLVTCFVLVAFASSLVGITSVEARSKKKKDDVMTEVSEKEPTTKKKTKKSKAEVSDQQGESKKKEAKKKKSKDKKEKAEKSDKTESVEESAKSKPHKTKKVKKERVDKESAPAESPRSAAPPVRESVKKVQAEPPTGSGMVWVNTDSKIFHREGSRWYGKTKQGEYMTESEALRAGYREAK